MSAPIRILVVDDSLTIRAMLETVFAREPGVKVVGIAASAEEAERMIDQFRPSVVTVDIAMPGMDGLALLDRLVVEGQTHVVMLSSHTEFGGRVAWPWRGRILRQKTNPQRCEGAGEADPRCC